MTSTNSTSEDTKRRLCLAGCHLSAAVGHANGGYWCDDGTRDFLLVHTVEDVRKAAAALGYDLVPMPLPLLEPQTEAAQSDAA